MGPRLWPDGISKVGGRECILVLHQGNKHAVKTELTVLNVERLQEHASEDDLSGVGVS